MKKRVLLFTILCAGKLYGMEPEQGLGNLPKDIHHEIVKKAIESSNTLEDAIKAVNVASALQGVKYDNLKDFTRLVHILVDKFPIIEDRNYTIAETTTNIANKFGTPTAKRYLDLVHALLNLIKYGKLDEVAQLIKDGADVNFVNDYGVTPLSEAVGEKKVEMVKLLLASGANPYFKNPRFEPALNYMQRAGITEEMKQILEEAMKK